MLSIKNTLIAGALAFAVGFLTGYSARDDQAEVERLNVAKYALDQEKTNLIQQLEVEHEHQKTAQINAAKTQETWMILKSVMLALSMNLMLCSCSSQSTPIPTPQHCPKMPQLPPQYHKVNVDALERTKQNFSDFMKNS